MATIDASPKKKRFVIPREPEARKEFYSGLIEQYKAKNPVKFEAKKEELEKKAQGFEYIAGRWVNVLDAANLKAELKLTASQKEQAAEQEEINRVSELEIRNKELEARLAALETPVETPIEESGEVKKPKGRPKKIK